MKILRLYMLMPFIYLYSCTSQKNETPVPEANNKGKELMEKNCYSCHDTQGTDKMLAPPMSRVKDHYLYEGVFKEEFVSSIVEWCKNPTEEMSQMPGARRKFGLMPKQNFDSVEVAAIAKYLYKTDMDNLQCSH